MLDLVLHIGLPKTGSTMLQHVFFPSVPGYLGKKRGSGHLGDFARQLVSFTPSCTISFQEWKTAASDWINRVVNSAYSNYPAPEQLIVSSENLSAIGSMYSPYRWPIGTGFWASEPAINTARHSIVPYLEALSNNLWKHGKVKVIIVLRNQPEWLASMYAQRSAFVRNASQQDFERQIGELINRGETYIDWSLLVTKLRAAVGFDNVLTLLYEDMQGQLFMDELFGFLGIKLDPLSNAPQDFGATWLNVRRTGDKGWRLRPFGRSRGYAAARAVSHRMSKCPPIISRIASRVVGELFDRPYNRLFDLMHPREGIEMTDTLRQNIRRYCRPFNERLAAELYRNDLDELGY
jgi:hypothetical protein